MSVATRDTVTAKKNEPTITPQAALKTISLRLELLFIYLYAVGLVFNAGGVKDVLLELFNKIVGAYKILKTN